MIVNQPNIGSKITYEKVMDRLNEDKKARELYAGTLKVCVTQMQQLMTGRPAPRPGPDGVYKGRVRDPAYNRRYFISAVQKGRVFNYISGIMPPAGMSRTKYFEEWGEHMAIPSDEIIALVELLNL